MPKKKHSVSDSRLMGLWRKAVLAYWNYTDPISGVCSPSGEGLQCHHIVRRRHYVLRWDYRNGIPLTVESHSLAHTGAGGARIRGLVDCEYLDRMEGVLKKDWLDTIEMSEDTWRLDVRDTLLQVIEEYGNGD